MYLILTDCICMYVFEKHFLLVVWVGWICIGETLFVGVLGWLGFVWLFFCGLVI